MDFGPLLPAGTHSARMPRSRSNRLARDYAIGISKARSTFQIMEFKIPFYGILAYNSYL